jgi:hypothetical protein
MALNINKKIILFLIVTMIFLGCGKKDAGSGGTPTPPPPPPPTPTASTCILSGVSQVNSEAALTAFYDNNLNVTRLLIFDSVNNIKRFDVNLNYVTGDSIRLDAYQYFRLDAGKRVILFVTKSDLKNPSTSDDYRFEYFYNAQGYLESKNLYINGSTLPNYKTVYTYSNNLVTKCVMTAVSSGNLKVLESDLIYNTSVTIKTWMYTFPDAIEGYMYFTVLNFGNRPTNPLQQVITKIFNTSTGAVLDTWTTNYSGYKVDSNGYLTYGIASGDLQQGMAMFYGKTNFYYLCH